MITHPEPDILEYEVKWALESTAVSKASAGDEIPAELFKILKADAIKVLHSIYQQTRQEKSILIPVPKKGSTTGCANHRTVALISHANKVMLKKLQARLQHHLN